MRLGLMSTMAALLACNGLALCQAPEVSVSGQTIDSSRSMQRGVLRPVAAVSTMQAPMPPAPAPMPMPMPGNGGDLTGAPHLGCGDGCGGNCCGGDLAERFSDDYRGWITGEYILWRFGGSFLRAFSTTVPAGNVTINAATVTFVNGIESASATATSIVPLQVLVNPSFPGGNGIDFRDQGGFRLTLGRWLDDNKCCGVEASFFWLPRHSVTVSNFLNPQVVTVDTGIAQQETTVNTQGTTVTTTGPTPVGDVFFTANLSSALVASTSNEIFGGEINARSRVFYMGPATLDLLGGMRFMQIHQKINMTDTIVVAPAGPGQTFSNPTGFWTGSATVTATQTAVTTDSINGYNDFIGPQVGLSFEMPCCYGFYISGYGKLGIGDMHQRFDVLGNTTGSNPQPGGLIVGGGDQPHQTSDRVCFMPEGNLTLGYACGPHFRVFGGYNITYFSAVSKLTNVTFTGNTGQTITLSSGAAGNTATGSTSSTGQSTTASSTTTSTAPGIRIGSADTSMQGLNLGLEIRW